MYSLQSTPKQLFLRSIEGKKNKYKRASLSPLRYAGGKSLAVGYITELIPSGVKRIISPFLGGGSLEIALNTKLGIEIIASDVLEPLVIYWNEQVNNPLALYKELKKLTPNKETYTEVKRQLKAYWDGSTEFTNLEIATMFYFNHNLSYGPSFLGWPSSVYMSEVKYNRMLEKVRRFKAKGSFKVSCESFENLFTAYPNDFFYCDPPYMLKADCPTSLMFAGIYPQRNFPNNHKGFNHTLLHKCIEDHKGGFVLSYNDCKRVKALYSNYLIRELEWQYTMGQGETRISKNRVAGTHIKKSHEVLALKYV